MLLRPSIALLVAACGGKTAATPAPQPAGEGVAMAGPYASLAIYCEPASPDLSRTPVHGPPYRFENDVITDSCYVDERWTARNDNGAIRAAAIVRVGDPFASTCAVAFAHGDAWWVETNPITCQTYNDIEETESRPIDIDFELTNDRVTATIHVSATGMSWRLAGVYRVTCARDRDAWRCNHEPGFPHDHSGSPIVNRRFLEAAARCGSALRHPGASKPRHVLACSRALTIVP